MTSTIDTTVPGTDSPLTSAPIRNNFVAAANDIDGIQSTLSTYGNMATQSQGNVTITGGSIAGTALNAGSVPSTALAPIANNTVFGNVSGISASPIPLTQTQLTALINTFAGGFSGAVPASGGGTTNFLRADGTFAVPPGSSSGTVTTTGSPSSGNLTRFSSSTSITNDDLSGDVTTSGSLVTTVAKIAGVAVGTPTGSGNVVFSNSPQLTTPALGTPSSVVLTNASGTAASLTAGAVTTINGHISAGTNISITGSGTIASPYDISSTGGGGGSPGGTNGQIQYNNSSAFGGDTATTDGSGNWSATSLNLSGLTVSELAATDGSKTLQSLTTATYPSLTEISYVKGVTSAIQTQINAKGTGTVTAVSVASANGFSGTSSGGATPALTLATSVTGVLLGNGTAISASNVTNDVQTKASIVPNTAPTAGQILVGNAGGTAYAPVAASGDITIASTGATTLATVNSNVGSFGNFTVNGKGLITAASTALANGTTATTQAAGDNTTNVATDAFVTTAIANAIAGVNPAVAVQAATTQASNTSSYAYLNGVSGVGATLTGPNNTALTVDGFTFTAVNQRILVKNDTQTTGGASAGAFNGVYYVNALQTAMSGVVLIRALDYDTPSDINSTGAIPVINGTVNGTTTWVETAQINTVGTDALVFTQFSYNPANVVTSITGTAHQVIASASTGAVTLSLPQSIDTTSTPQFAQIGIGAAASGASPVYIKGTASNSVPFFRMTDGTNELDYYIGTGPNVQFGTPQNIPFLLFSNNTTCLSILGSGFVGVGNITPASHFEIGGNVSSAAWGNTGIAFNSRGSTFTDTSTAANATVTTAQFHSIQAPVLATTNTGITYTNASTLYISGPPTAGANTPTLTNAWAINVGAGNVQFPGTANVLGTITSGTWNGTAVGAAYGGTGISTSSSTGFATVSSGTWSITNTVPAGTVVGTTDTQTLTNKRVTPRVGTTTSSGTPTINTDNFDVYNITAQAAAITSFTTNLSGTPTEAQKLIIEITDNGSPQTIAWGASFESTTTALPTTTAASTKLRVGFMWNSANNKFSCVAVA